MNNERNDESAKGQLRGSGRSTRVRFARVLACALVASGTAAHADQVWLNCNLDVSSKTFGATGIPTCINGCTDGRDYTDNFRTTMVVERGSQLGLFLYKDNALYPQAGVSADSTTISWVNGYSDPEGNHRLMRITVDRVTLRATLQAAPNDWLWALPLTGSGQCTPIAAQSVAQPQV
jgi:hypothetical protein